MKGSSGQPGGAAKLNLRATLLHTMYQECRATKDKALAELVPRGRHLCRCFSASSKSCPNSSP
jgi:hypothetical protein